MSMRVITAHLNGSKDDKAVLGHALTLAQDFGGHIDATYAIPNPCVAPPPVGMGLFPGVYRDLAAQAEGLWQEKVDKAEKRFEEWRADAGIEKSADPLGGAKPSVGWRVVSDELAAARLGSLSDIIVSPLPSERTAESDPLVFELSLLHQGRPVLFVPPGGKAADFVMGSVLIAWNGTIESFHAVVAALPILRKAKSVHVCTIAEKDFTPKIAEQLIAYLAWQGIAARAVTPPKAKSVEAALQSAIKAADADLLVMGAYSHSRLREMVFGGVTRHFLGAAKIPVLMAH